MKTISVPAMAAIEAGEAIVTGALEIYTPGRSPVGVPEATDVVLSWQQSGDAFGTPDKGGMSLEFFDETNTSLGVFSSTIINVPAEIWTLRTLNATTPLGAIRMRVSMLWDRESGSSCDQAFDAISVTVGGTLVPLVNAGAELGDTTGWNTLIPGTLLVYNTLHRVFTGGSSDYNPYEGSYFFYGGSNSLITAYQDVYLAEVLPIEPGVVEAALRVWGGYGPITLDGVVYEGIGDRGLVQQTAGAVGGIAQGMELTLSRIEPNLLALLDAGEIHGGAAIMRRLIFASDGKTLLDYDIWDRGRVDTVQTVETIGGGAAIKVSVESAARGLGRAGQRMRSDSDQRLINPNDGYFRFCSYAGEKMLYWGGKKPERVGGTTFIGSPASGGV